MIPLDGSLLLFIDKASAAKLLHGSTSKDNCLICLSTQHVSCTDLLYYGSDHPPLAPDQRLVLVRLLGATPLRYYHLVSGVR